MSPSHHDARYGWDILRQITIAQITCSHFRHTITKGVLHRIIMSEVYNPVLIWISHRTSPVPRWTHLRQNLRFIRFGFGLGLREDAGSGVWGTRGGVSCYYRLTFSPGLVLLALLVVYLVLSGAVRPFPLQHSHCHHHCTRLVCWCTYPVHPARTPLRFLSVPGLDAQYSAWLQRRLLTSRFSSHEKFMIKKMLQWDQKS